MGREVFSQIALGQLSSYLPNNEADLHLTSYAKVKVKWLTDRNVRAKIYKSWKKRE